MFLNVYQPRLQHVGGVVSFLRGHRGAAFASSALMDPISKAFVGALHRYCQDHQVPLVDFVRGQRKDDLAHEYLAEFEAAGGTEGVLFIGRAQEKTRVFRTEKRRNPITGASYPWIVSGTGIVNQFYVYAVDADFGPFFLKFSSYFPTTPSSASTATSGPSGKPPRPGSPSPPWTPGSPVARTTVGCKRSAVA